MGVSPKWDLKVLTTRVRRCLGISGTPHVRTIGILVSVQEVRIVIVSFKGWVLRAREHIQSSPILTVAVFWFTSAPIVSVG